MLLHKTQVVNFHNYKLLNKLSVCGLNGLNINSTFIFSLNKNPVKKKSSNFPAPDEPEINPKIIFL